MIVVDLLLLGMDRLSLFTKIITPVLLLTTKDQVEDRRADDYLVKPFTFSEELARLRALQWRSLLPLNTVLQIKN